MIAMDPCVRLSSLFDYPIVTRSWRRTNVDENLCRFGLLWWAYDWVRSHTNDPLLILTPLGALPQREEDSQCCVLGGDCRVVP